MWTCPLAPPRSVQNSAKNTVKWALTFFIGFPRRVGEPAAKGQSEEAHKRVSSLGGQKGYPLGLRLLSPEELQQAQLRLSEAVPQPTSFAGGLKKVMIKV